MEATGHRPLATGHFFRLPPSPFPLPYIHCPLQARLLGQLLPGFGPFGQRGPLGHRIERLGQSLDNSPGGIHKAATGGRAAGRDRRSRLCIELSKLLDQPPTSAGDLQAANRSLDAYRGTAAAPLGPGGLKIVAPQHRQQPTKRPIVEIQLQHGGQGPKPRRAVERLSRLEHDGNIQPAEDLAHQPADLLRRAEHDRNLTRPRLAIDQQPFDPRGDQFDFADLTGRRENFDAGDGGGGGRGAGKGEES